LTALPLRSLRRFGSILAIPVALLCTCAAGCSQFKADPVEGAPPGTIVEKVHSLKAAETPADSAVANAKLADLEASLRRVVVRYTRYTAFVQTDPLPLLSEEQVLAYAQILIAELPKLKPRERLRFSFTDRYYGRGFDVVMEVYPEGTRLVYSFNALAASKDMPLTDGGSPQFMGILQRQAGQEVKNLSSLAWVKDPLVPDEREASALADAKVELLEGAKDLLEPGEAERLEALVKLASPSLDAWKAYWEKRRTLQKAQQQGLIDRTAYLAQINRLNAELER
jgi:hypothetical protein